MGRHVDRKFIWSLVHQYYHNKQRHHKFCFCDSWAIPFVFYGKFFTRSGILKEHSVIVEAGVIDSDYRGEVSALLFNHHPQKSFTVKEVVDFYKKKQIEIIKNNGCKVVVELLNVTRKNIYFVYF